MNADYYYFDLKNPQMLPAWSGSFKKNRFHAFMRLPGIW